MLNILSIIRNIKFIHKIILERRTSMKIKCDYCGGKGVVECDCTGGLGKRAADSDCYACGGSGVHTCPACNGSGKVDDED